MADITITIPNDKVELVKNALGYQAQIHNMETGEMEDNPETPLAFAQRIIIDFLKGRVKQYEKRVAIQNLNYTDVGVE